MVFAVAAGFFGSKLPASFLPEEDQGYVYIALQLPDAASLQRTDEVCKKDRGHPRQDARGRDTRPASLASACLARSDTYNGFFFVTLEEWEERKKPEEQYEAIRRA